MLKASLFVGANAAPSIITTQVQIALCWKLLKRLDGNKKALKLLKHASKTVFKFI